MNTNDDERMELMPQDDNTYIMPAEEEASGKKSRRKGLGAKVKGDLLGYGLSVAGTLLNGIARQGVSLSESVKNDMASQGATGKDFKDVFKENLIEHVWKLADHIDDNIGDDNKELSKNVTEHLSEAAGVDLSPLFGAVHGVWNDFAALEAARNMRSSMGSSDTARDEGLKEPEDVEAFFDLIYGADPIWNSTDIYRPKDSRDASGNLKMLPVIINVHGGAWVYGDKEHYKFYCMSLAKEGFAVINFSYRLAPENKFPAALCDINDLIIWMEANSEKYGLDMDNLFMMSDSAGANLSGLYICILNNRDYAANFDFTAPRGIRINAAVFNCGAFDPLKFIGEKELMKGLVAGEGKYMQEKLLNVSDHVNAKFPPSFMMSCYGDFCIKFLKPMVAAFSKYGVRHEVKIYGTEEEPLHHVFHLDVKSTLGQEIRALECDFLRQYII